MLGGMMGGAGGSSGAFNPQSWTGATSEIGSWFSQNPTNVSRDLSQSGSGHEINTGTETVTEGLDIDVSGVMKYVNNLLKDPTIGLSSIIGQDRMAGLYGSSSAAFSTNDLLDKIAGTIAQLTAKKTTSKTTDLTKTYGQVGGVKESVETEKPGFISELFGGVRQLFSDSRLKEDIKRIGTTPGGYPWYSYTFLGLIPEQGVLAQDLLTLLPDAVSLHPNGFYMVDYSKVH